MKKFKTGDNVIVISGKFKKTLTTIVSVSDNKVFLKDVNIMKKAKKGQGFIDLHHPIHISNISHVDPVSKTPTRINFSLVGSTKTRVTKKSNSILA